MPKETVTVTIAQYYRGSWRVARKRNGKLLTQQPLDKALARLRPIKPDWHRQDVLNYGITTIEASDGTYMLRRDDELYG